MSNLPTLPGCGQPATVRIEVYGPDAAGDPFGSLDASVYVCEEHGIDTASAVWGAGMTAHKVEMAPDVTRACGEVYIFPTGNLGDPACRYCGRRGNLIRVTSVFEGDYWSCPPGEHQPNTGGQR